MECRNSKKCKNITFSIVFCKKWKFWQVHLSMVRKKNFPGGSDGPKMVFNTILWYAAIKIWHRLIRFLHFWWFDFLIFWLPKKCQKSHLQKNAILQYFSPNFINFAHFFVIFHVFCLQNSFVLSKIFRFLGNFEWTGDEGAQELNFKTSGKKLKWIYIWQKF